MKDKIYKCCLCKTIHRGYGNNPAPLVVDEKSKCCDECNMKVLEARLGVLFQHIYGEKNSE
jgi:hypothetical protein